MLKKGDWHESAREPVINYVEGHDRSERPDKNRDTYHELKTRTYWTSIIERTAIGVVYFKT